MADRERRREREKLLNRISELNREIAETFQRMKEGEAPLPVIDQFTSELQRLIHRLKLARLGQAPDR
jgi:TATA-binding protein-associated factor Taf7